MDCFSADLLLFDHRKLGLPVSHTLHQDWDYKFGISEVELLPMLACSSAPRSGRLLATGRGRPACELATKDLSYVTANT